MFGRRFKNLDRLSVSAELVSGVSN